MRSTQHPYRKARQTDALARRESDLARYQSGNFDKAKNRDLCIAHAKEDIANLKRTLHIFTEAAEAA